MNNNRGFTLIEIVVAAAVSLILVLSIGAAIESALKSSGGVERKVTAIQDVRTAVELMAMEIRMASYNPTFAPNNSLWMQPNCSGLSTNPTWKGIQAATANSITVEMDIAGAIGTDGKPDGDGTLSQSNEIISYNYISTPPEGYITRDANCGGLLNPPPPAFLGDLSASTLGTRTVIVINSQPNINLPIFRYFDGQGTEWPIDTNKGINTNQIPNIRMIEITLAVQTEEINPDTRQPRIMIYSTREILRNH